jgi:hypothetical protein
MWVLDESERGTEFKRSRTNRATNPRAVFPEISMVFGGIKPFDAKVAGHVTYFTTRPIKRKVQC